MTNISTMYDEIQLKIVNSYLNLTTILFDVDQRVQVSCKTNKPETKCTISSLKKIQ